MINKIYFLILLILINGCTFFNYQAAGVFNDPYQYQSKKYRHPLTTEVKIDNSIYELSYIGECGSKMGFFTFLIPLPLIPYKFSYNNCERNDFSLGIFLTTKISNTKFYLKYNNKTYNSYLKDYLPDIHKGRFKYVKFKISSFSAFKKAKDKTLIITKKMDNGNIITKEIPFEWKITSHVVSIP